MDRPPIEQCQEWAFYEENITVNQVCQYALTLESQLAQTQADNAELEQYKAALKIAGQLLSEGDCIATMTGTEKPEWCNSADCDVARCWEKYCLAQAEEALAND